tara:strand:+ start:103 stop:621 length:519 start_codon:yes stop_codon:yes gene_type:complete
MKQLFNSLTPEHIRLRQHTQEICRQFSRSPSKGNLKRLKQLFAQSGEQVIIEGPFYCDYGDKVSLGDRVYINTHCTILDGGIVNIGNDCMLGPNVQLLTVSHDVDPIKRLNKTSYVNDIHIEHNVWLGAGVIVLAGVTIGENSVVGAGSVVTKNVPPNTMVVGNPAAVIKFI